MNEPVISRYRCLSVSFEGFLPTGGQFLSYSGPAHEFALPHSVLFKRVPGVVCLRHGERPASTVAGDVNAEYMRDVCHVRRSKATHELLFQHLEHRLLASSKHRSST